MNQICVIEGDYSEFNDLNQLIGQYLAKFPQVKHIKSIDGSELFKNYELNYNTTILNNESIIDKDNTTIASTTLTNTSSAPNRYHIDSFDDQNVTYTCFLVNNFDNTNKIFSKLEEIQTKCSNSSHRFLIYGIPILKYCNELSFVSFN
jgi:hypothetical protein